MLKKDMPRYELEVGILLCCCAFLSLVVHAWHNRPKEGAIKLPVYDDGGLTSDAELEDPFNVTKPEDVINGYPIREEMFLLKVLFSLMIHCSVLFMGFVRFEWAPLE